MDETHHNFETPRKIPHITRYMAGNFFRLLAILFVIWSVSVFIDRIPRDLKIILEIPPWKIFSNTLY